MNKSLLGMTIVILSTASLIGCNKTQEGAGWGAGIGALAGQAIGGDTGGTEAKVGGSTRPYPKQLMAGPMGIATFAPTDLRGNRKREDELYG